MNEIQKKLAEGVLTKKYVVNEKWLNRFTALMINLAAWLAIATYIKG